MQDLENKVSPKTEETRLDGKVYELGYLLLPTIKEEDLSINYGDLKNLIVSLGGEIISDDMPRMINLAYPISKVISNTRSLWSNAYFGWIKFTLDPGKISELKNRLELDSNVIRFLVLKTVKENTIASKRFMREGGYRKQKPKTMEKENVEPINKEEIDKEIEALVAA